MKKLSISIFILLAFIILFAACKSNNIKTEQLAKDEIYTCTMHNEVMSDHPGECPRCGMKLVKQKITTEQQKMMKEGTYVKP